MGKILVLFLGFVLFFTLLTQVVLPLLGSKKLFWAFRPSTWANSDHLKDELNRIKEDEKEVLLKAEEEIKIKKEELNSLKEVLKK